MNRSTKEPWTLDNGLVYGVEENGSPSFDIFDTANWNGTDEEGQAIASLIYAAPVMRKVLEFLEDKLGFYEGSEEPQTSDGKPVIWINAEGPDGDFQIMLAMVRKTLIAQRVTLSVPQDSRELREIASSIDKALATPAPEPRVIPDGAHHSGLMKDYGGRYNPAFKAPSTGEAERRVVEAAKEWAKPRPWVDQEPSRRELIEAVDALAAQQQESGE